MSITNSFLSSFAGLKTSTLADIMRDHVLSSALLELDGSLEDLLALNVLPESDFRR